MGTSIIYCKDVFFVKDKPLEQGFNVYVYQSNSGCSRLKRDCHMHVTAIRQQSLVSHISWSIITIMNVGLKDTHVLVTGKLSAKAKI